MGNKMETQEFDREVCSVIVKTGRTMIEALELIKANSRHLVFGFQCTIKHEVMSTTVRRQFLGGKESEEVGFAFKNAEHKAGVSELEALRFLFYKNPSNSDPIKREFDYGRLLAIQNIEDINDLEIFSVRVEMVGLDQHSYEVVLRGCDSFKIKISARKEAEGWIDTVSIEFI